MGNKAVRVNGKTLEIDDKEYKLAPGLIVLISETSASWSVEFQ